jgi:hypothetical protein
MRHSLRIGVVLGWAILGGSTAGLAQGVAPVQGRTPATAQPGLASQPQGGGLAAPAWGNPLLSPGFPLLSPGFPLLSPGFPLLSPGFPGGVLAPGSGRRPLPSPGRAHGTPAPGPASSSFHRVTTTWRGAGGVGGPIAADPLQPYSVQAQPARNSRAAAGSISYSAPSRPVSGPPALPATTHNYYPGMRPAQHPNANTARTSGRSGKARFLPSGGQLLTGAARRR